MLVILLLALVGGVALSACGNDVEIELSLPNGAAVEVYTEGLDRPASMDIAPDGTIFVAEQLKGTVRIVEPGGELLEEPLLELDIGTVIVNGFTETGLLGVVVDPRFEENHYLYVYYSKPSEGLACVVERYRVEGEAIFDKELLRIDACATNGAHIGGRMLFAADETLLVTVGDLVRDGTGKPYKDGSVQPATSWAQRLDLRPGKLLRLNRDGSVPADNPMLEVQEADPFVYAYGFRNPYGLALRPNGEIYLSDNGTTKSDELNLVQAGGNYGWSLALGFEDKEEDQIAPILDISPSLGVTGMAFYTGQGFPEWDGVLLICQVKGGGLRVVDVTSAEVKHRVLDLPCQTDVKVGEDGVYLLHYGTGTIHRIH
jgi:glucose/arabinose dehydrogenase